MTRCCETSRSGNLDAEHSPPSPLPPNAPPGDTNVTWKRYRNTRSRRGHKVKKMAACRQTDRDRRCDG